MQSYRKSPKYTAGKSSGQTNNVIEAKKAQSRLLFGRAESLARSTLHGRHLGFKHEAEMEGFRKSALLIDMFEPLAMISDWIFDRPSRVGQTQDGTFLAMALPGKRRGR